MHRHTSGLVNHQQGLVFKNHLKLRNWHCTDGRGDRPLCDPHRGNAYHVARMQPRIRRSPRLIDAHLAAADQAVNMGFGHAFKLANQIVVQPLPI